jgi:hypothetical protein
LEAVPGKHSIDSLQKTAIVGTAHIIRKVLQCEAGSVSGGDHRWFKRSTGKEGLVTRDIHITIIITIIIHITFQNIRHNSNSTCTTHCNHRRAATPDTLETCKYPAKG